MKCVRVLLPLGLGLLLTGCQVEPVPDAPATADSGGVAAAEKPQGYVALPGQAATSQTPTDTDAAFDAAAAALKANAAQQAAVAQVAEKPAEPEPINADPPAVQQVLAAAQPPAAPEEQPATVTPLAEVKPAMPTAAPQPTGEAAGYALQITNGTLGRLYIEVQDDGGNIFPFGFMYSHQRLCAQPQEAKPIQGRLTIVIRDPDSPGAPEVRRYQVTPPPNYMGKTLSVTILPGRYRAAVDGEVYYTSPLPEETPATEEQKPAAP